jgi:hypothetical protein
MPALVHELSESPLNVAVTASAVVVDQGALRALVDVPTNTGTLRVELVSAGPGSSQWLAESVTEVG